MCLFGSVCGILMDRFSVVSVTGYIEGLLLLSSKTMGMIEWELLRRDGLLTEQGKR